MGRKYREGELLFRVIDDLTSYLENLKQQDCIVDYEIGNEGLCIKARFVESIHFLPYQDEDVPFKHITVELNMEED